MLAEVRRTIRREGMLRPDEPVWVAVSGGVDSMVLLHVLLELGHPCSVAHVDHGLRGAESDADRDLVEARARALGLPFRSVRVDPKAAIGGGSVQMAARDLRYAWFGELLREGPHTMALGHHRDDVAETLLLHLLRGIGTHGWAGIPPVTVLDAGMLCRPLFDVGREAILAYAKERAINFREDASNTDPKYLRNRVRGELLPLMEALRPGARRTLARGAGLMRELRAAAEAHVDHVLQGAVTRVGELILIDLERVLGSPAPHVLLAEALKGADPHPDQLGQLLEAARSRSVGAVFQWGNTQVTVERGRLVVGSAPGGFPSFSIAMAERMEGHAGPFTWRQCAPEAVDLAQGMDTAWLDLDNLEFPLLLRPWQPGDRMKPVGTRGSKLVSDILTDAGTVGHERSGAYVLVSAGEVVWLAGHRIAAGVSPGNGTREVLRLTFHR
jgi:tRNA(Ile)-lysidine synthase